MKVQGSYASIVRGVSQQNPADRLEGQHGEVVNMIADPVRGLVRRNGSVLRGAQYSAVGGTGNDSLNGGDGADLIADAQADSYSFRAHEHTQLGTPYDVLYRSRARVGNTANNLLGLHVFDKTPGSNAFVPVEADPTDTDWPLMLAGGFSAITSLGRYVLFGSNSLKPTSTAVNAWGALDNQNDSVVWVRGGGYARTYTVKARRASTGVTFTASYTTKAAAYEGAYSVDSILAQSPNFQKDSVDILNVKTFTGPETAVSFDAPTDYFVNGIGNDARRAVGTGAIFRIFQRNAGVDDLTKYIDIKIQALRPGNAGFVADIIDVKGGPWSINGTTSVARLYDHDENPNYSVDLNNQTAAYNEEVNRWTAEAAADIVPSRIAENLRLALIAAGFPGWVRTASHLFSDDCDTVQVADSGADDFLVGLSNQTRSSDEVTPIHKIAKILKVAPKGNEDGSYYLESFAKNEGNSDTYQDVIWREAAGVVQTPDFIFGIGTAVNGTFYVASTPAILQAYVLADADVDLEVPQFQASAAGDAESNLPPPFFENGVTGFFVFQDRLGILAGGQLAMSEVGDYFNFYRTTVLTVPDSDPISGGALGSEGDVMRKTALYDRNLIIFGDRAVYNISGRAVQTPQTFNIGVQLNVDNTSFAQPIGAGQNVSFLKEDSQMAATRMMQVKVGAFQDSPVVDDVSKQLRDYINGTPAEMVSLVSPDVIFVRTEHFFKTQGGFPRARPWGLYVYSYLDQPNGERLLDSWSAWEWSTALGTPVGMTPVVGGDGIMVYTLAWGTNQLGAATRGLLAQSFSARPDPTGLPYLDALQQGAAAETTGLWTPAASGAVQSVVYTAYGAGYSYSAVPSATDADRFTGLTHPHYTLGDAAPELTDALRWEGLQGWYSNAVTAFGAAKADNLWTGLEFPAFVDLTNPHVRDRDGKAITLGRLTLTKLRVTTTRTAGFTGTFIDYRGNRTSQDYGGDYYRFRYDTNVWVGRNVHDVQVRLAAKAWYPLTISAIEWQGQFFLNGRRV